MRYSDRIRDDGVALFSEGEEELATSESSHPACPGHSISVTQRACNMNGRHAYLSTISIERWTMPRRCAMMRINVLYATREAYSSSASDDLPCS